MSSLLNQRNSKEAAQLKERHVQMSSLSHWVSQTVTFLTAYMRIYAYCSMTMIYSAHFQLFVFIIWLPCSSFTWSTVQNNPSVSHTGPHGSSYLEQADLAHLFKASSLIAHFWLAKLRGSTCALWSFLVFFLHKSLHLFMFMVVQMSMFCLVSVNRFCLNHFDWTVCTAISFRCYSCFIVWSKNPPLSAHHWRRSSCKGWSFWSVCLLCGVVRYQLWLHRCVTADHSQLSFLTLAHFSLFFWLCGRCEVTMFPDMLDFCWLCGCVHSAVLSHCNSALLNIKTAEGGLCVTEALMSSDWALVLMINVFCILYVQ